MYLSSSLKRTIAHLFLLASAQAAPSEYVCDWLVCTSLLTPPSLSLSPCMYVEQKKRPLTHPLPPHLLLQKSVTKRCQFQFQHSESSRRQLGRMVRSRAVDHSVHFSTMGNKPAGEGWIYLQPGLGTWRSFEASGCPLEILDHEGWLFPNCPCWFESRPHPDWILGRETIAWRTICARAAPISRPSDWMGQRCRRKNYDRPSWR